MTEHRLRQPIQKGYAEALGMATYCFAICEWNAIYCAEKLRPGTIVDINKKKFTAGRIARNLLSFSEGVSEADHRQRLVAAAKRFVELVNLRNAIMHAKPCTGLDSKPYLSSSEIIRIEDLIDAANKFSACSIELNDIFHNILAKHN